MTSMKYYRMLLELKKIAKLNWAYLSLIFLGNLNYIKVQSSFK